MNQQGNWGGTILFLQDELAKALAEIAILKVQMVILQEQVQKLEST